MEIQRIEESLYVFSLYRRLRRWLICILFGAPIFIFRLDLLIWPANYQEINSSPIGFIWCTIAPTAVIILICLEAFAENLKLSKYYYCVTLFIYEFIWILSILLYIYTLDMNTWSITGRLRAFKNTPFKTAFVFLAEFVLFITNKPSICSHWIKNSIVHISLCRCKILAREPEKNQYDLNPIWYLFVKDILQLIAIVVQWCGILILPLVFRNPDQSLEFAPIFLNTDLPSSISCFSTSPILSAWLTGNQKFFDRKFYININLYSINQYFTIGVGMIIIFMDVLFLALNGLRSSDHIWLLICCLSTGRQAILHMEICPEKYEEHNHRNRIFPNNRMIRLNG